MKTQKSDCNIPNMECLYKEANEYVERFVNELGADFNILSEYILVKIGTIKIHINTLDEFYILNEVFYEGCYNYISKKENICLLDIGMNVGIASLFFAQKNNVECIYGYEPIFETYQKALKNFELNNHISQKIHAMNFGLSSNNETSEMAFTNKVRGRARNVEFVTEKEEFDTIIQVEKRKASHEIHQIILNHPNMNFVLKLDCEGDEIEILNDVVSNPSIMSNICVVLMEWHWNYPSSLIKSLQDLGYSIIVTKNKNKTGFFYGFLQ